MKKIRLEKISKTEVQVRNLIAAALTVLLSTGEIKGFPFYFLLVVILLLVYSIVVEKSMIKARFYSSETVEE
jgi:preprotein translocase subunit SecD